MAELDNPRHEEFAKLTATGHKRADAYLAAGYHTQTRKVATKRGVALFAMLEIKARVTEIETELHENSVRRAEVDREFVLRELKDVYQSCRAEKPVKNRQGHETGTYQFNAAGANRALELMGKELGMFTDRIMFENQDDVLEGLSGEDLRAFVRQAAADVGLRVMEMTEEETRTFIVKNAEHVGLCVSPFLTH